MKGYEARVFDEPRFFARDFVSIAVRSPQGDYLMPDGTWQRFEEGSGPPEMGMQVPREAIEAIAQAIAEFQGHTSHADTEARVLREWLAVERERVDRAMAR